MGYPEARLSKPVAEDEYISLGGEWVRKQTRWRAQLLPSQEAFLPTGTAAPVTLAQALCTFLSSFIHQNFIDQLLGPNTSFLAPSLG